MKKKRPELPRQAGRSHYSRLTANAQQYRKRFYWTRLELIRLRRIARELAGRYDIGSIYD